MRSHTRRLAPCAWSGCEGGGGVATFREKLTGAVRRASSLVCVGLAPDPARVPRPLRGRDDWLGWFGAGIVEATADLVCAYKPNLAFYEALGAAGWTGLRQTLGAVPAGIPVLADAKRGDIGSS